MDDTLDAELHAARASARRRRTLRDVFLDAEDRSDRVAIVTTDGRGHLGTVTAVGVDHVTLEGDGMCRTVALRHIASVEVP
jgi:hypothetical protein